MLKYMKKWREIIKYKITLREKLKFSCKFVKRKTEKNRFQNVNEN